MKAIITVIFMAILAVGGSEAVSTPNPEDLYRESLSLLFASANLDESCVDTALNRGEEFYTCVLTDAVNIFGASAVLDNLPDLDVENATTFAAYATGVNTVLDTLCDTSCLNPLFEGVQDHPECFPGGESAIPFSIAYLNFVCSSTDDDYCLAFEDIVLDLADFAAIENGQQPAVGNTTLDDATTCGILSSQADYCVGTILARYADQYGLDDATATAVRNTLIANCDAQGHDLSSEADATAAPAISTSAASGASVTLHLVSFMAIIAMLLN
jgi:hypothetical protein